MKRAIRRFVSTLHGPKKWIFFIVLALVCIVAICMGIYTQFFYKYVDTDPLMLGINIGSKKTAEEIDILKADFNGLFTNSILINSENVRVDRIEPSNELVYVGYNLVNEDENYYSVNAQIPILNINTDVAKEVNREIKSEYYDKANAIMRKTEGNTVYNVSYAAFVNQDILSLVIKSSLKEQDKSEKVSIKTYCYSLPDSKLLSINNVLESSELLVGKGLTLENIQTTINDEVKKAYNNAKIIAENYGTLYERDLKSDIYNIEKTQNFFLTQDGYIYIVYAYGNNDYTNEMDIIIF